MGGMAVEYDFDQVVERRGTDSVKWCRYSEDVLPLWVADMDFRSPQPVIDALRDRVEHGVFGYGTESPEVRAVIQERLQRLYGWNTQPGDYLFTPGIVVALNLVARALSEPGEEILIQPPVYPPFFGIEKNSGRAIQQAPLVYGEGGYGIDFDAFERAITPRTRIFLLCNPHNPVGRMFTRAELERLAEICLRHELFICSDEIHMDFIFDGRAHIPIASIDPEVAARTVTLFSPSKSYNIAGFHFGIAAASDPAVRERLRTAGAGMIANHVGVLDLVAGIAAYRYGDEWFNQLLPYLQSNRDYVLRYAREHLPGISAPLPEGSYLAWLDCRGAGIEGPPADFFLREAKVALMDGAFFGDAGRGFVRLNFGCPRSILEEALDRMRAALLGR
jgi:cysteine-S-conjugate beta-lyase